MEKKDYMKPCVEEVELERPIILDYVSENDPDNDPTKSAKDFDGADANLDEEDE